MFAYSGSRGHKLSTALLVGALSSRHAVLTATITDKERGGTHCKTVCSGQFVLKCATLTFLRKPQPKSGHFVAVTVVTQSPVIATTQLSKWQRPTQTHMQPQCNDRLELGTWSECRTAGQGWHPGPVGSPDPVGPQLKCVRLGSSHNRTGCSGGPGRSREGHGPCWSGSDLSLMKPSRGSVNTSQM